MGEREPGLGHGVGDADLAGHPHGLGEAVFGQGPFLPVQPPCSGQSQQPPHDGSAPAVASELFGPGQLVLGQQSSVVLEHRMTRLGGSGLVLVA